MRFTVVKPIITEVSIQDAKRGKFTFLVDNAATKTDIKSEIQKLYNVSVKGVTTVTIRRSRTVNTRFGRKTNVGKIKKARVMLAEGQSIPAFEFPDEEKKKKKEDSK